MRRRQPFNTPYAVSLLVRMIRAFEEIGGMTINTLVTELSITDVTARKYVRELHRRRVIYVLDWTDNPTDARLTARVWGIPEDDMPRKNKTKPKAKCRALLQREQRKKAKKGVQRDVSVIALFGKR